MKWLPNRSDKPASIRMLIEVVVIIGLLIYLLTTLGYQQLWRNVRDTPALMTYVWYHQIQRPTDFKVDFYGVTYLGRSGNNLDDITLAYGAQEKPMLFFLRDVSQALNKPNLVFYDIGANVGQHTLFMSQIAKEVHSFEPYPPVLERLKANISYNHLANVQIHEIGLGDTNEVLTYFKPQADDSGTGGFVPRGTWGAEKFDSLPICKGDDWIQRHKLNGPDLIKCDIEGYEKPALEGLKNTLHNNRPIIAMEITTGAGKSFTSLEDLIKTLPEGYEITVFCDWDDKNGHYKFCSPDINFGTLGIYNLVAYPMEKRAIMKRLFN